MSDSVSGSKVLVSFRDHFFMLGDGESGGSHRPFCSTDSQVLEVINRC